MRDVDFIRVLSEDTSARFPDFAIYDALQLTKIFHYYAATSVLKGENMLANTTLQEIKESLDKLIEAK